MFKRTLIAAFNWSYKWYFGSISTSLATFFLLENYFEFERLRSFRYGVALFILTFLFRSLYSYIKQIDQLEKLVKEKEARLDNLDTSGHKQKVLTAYNYYGEVIIKLRDSFSNKFLLLINFKKPYGLGIEF